MKFYERIRFAHHLKNEVVRKDIKIFSVMDRIKESGQNSEAGVEWLICVFLNKHWTTG